MIDVAPPETDGVDRDLDDYSGYWEGRATYFRARAI